MCFRVGGLNKGLATNVCITCLLAAGGELFRDGPGAHRPFKALATAPGLSV